MRKIIATAIIALSSTFVYSQTDFFGGLAPKKTTKVVNLPNMPNKTDEQGRKQGKWAKKYPNGRYIYVAEFVDGQPVDTLKRYFENGNISMYQIFNTDNDSCYVINYNENGTIASKGVYFDKKKEGLWLFYDANGNVITESSYSKDLINGKSITYYPTGEILEVIHYTNNIQHGQWNRYYKTGSMQIKATYNNGKLHGLYKVINDNGDVSIEGTYTNGKQTGDWKVFDNDIRKYFIMKYDKNGKLLNKDEIDKRSQDRLNYYEKNRHNLEDPANYINDPSSFNF